MSIKVMVVDDSAFMRKIVSDILSEDSNIEVISTARNGKDALDKLRSVKPDIITLDVEMPIMNGIDTLKKMIYENYNIPVIMLSSITTEGAELTLKALELGAVDFITKPTSIFKLDSSDKKKEIIEKIKTAAKVRITKSVNLVVNIDKRAKKSNKKNKENFNNLICIGTSTGGPKALQNTIPNIPADINASVLVVQHMPSGFTKSLANRLDNMSELTVKEAENNECVKGGHCYIAPGDKHMKVVKGVGKDIKIKLTEDKLVSGHRPSVDVLFNSASKVDKINILGVILTGMGSDGANGIKNIKNSGGYTIAQDEESSVVYGMPKSALKMGAIDKVLPLSRIVEDIINKVGV